VREERTGVRGCFQRYRGSVRRPTVGLRPLLLSRAQGRRRDEIFRRDEAFERGEPMVVISRTVIGFAAPARGGELLGKRG
jgi:hypothetical protein